MDAALRLARERLGISIVLPAVLSWILLFGYQWAFFLRYHGLERTVFSYLSGVIGDGVLIPIANVGAFLVLRELWPFVRLRRLPLYIALGFITAFACFLAQAGLEIVNWSMPAPFVWSEVGQFHFFVMWSEITFLYVAMAVSINNWSALRADLLAWRSYLIGWAALVLFGLTLVGDVIRFSGM
jgi:hypothetical protein